MTDKVVKKLEENRQKESGRKNKEWSIYDSQRINEITEIWSCENSIGKVLLLHVWYFFS